MPMLYVTNDEREIVSAINLAEYNLDKPLARQSLLGEILEALDCIKKQAKAKAEPPLKGKR